MRNGTKNLLNIDDETEGEMFVLRHIKPREIEQREP